VVFGPAAFRLSTLDFWLSTSMWHGILGHDDVVERFRRTLERGRLASTYLFVGPAGIGKRRFALELAKALLCSETDDRVLEACGRCESCRLFAAGNHPDLDVVGLPPNKSDLPISMFIGDKDHRHQEGLCHRISLKPYLGRRRIAIIDDADHFNQESANCLLKTLEEPPPESLLILIGTSPSRQLPTIRSRAQIVRFGGLPPVAIREILEEQGIAEGDRAAKLAESCEGSVERAAEIVTPELWDFRVSLLERLARPRWDAVETGKWVLDFVQAAGDEAALRRHRLRFVIGLVMDYYRKLLRLQAGKTGDEQQAGESRSSIVDAAPSLESLDACLAALEQVDRNANLALVVSYWLCSLARPAH
jgi:DNA polymerase III subunit delta'